MLTFKSMARLAMSFAHYVVALPFKKRQAGFNKLEAKLEELGL